MKNLWDWYISLFSDEDNKVIVAAWSVTLATLTFIITFLIKPIFKYLRAESNTPNSQERKHEEAKSKTKPNIWDAIRPPNSQYELMSDTKTGIPAGVQTFAFEYSPNGHAYSLNLKGKIARVEIQFSCRISNLFKVMYEANEYALNFLQPQFLIDARIILEKYSINKLRDNRQEIANEISVALKNKFEDYGVTLLSVTLGAVDEIVIKKFDNSKK